MTASLTHLRERLHAMETAARPACTSRLSTGHAALDGLLPEKGLRRGTLVEWLEHASGAGAGTLAMTAAREACREGRTLVVVDCAGEKWGGEFYPPGAASLGFNVDRLLLVRPTSAKDADWAIHQALVSTAPGAVLAWVSRTNERMVRRWQLAVEQSAGLGLFVRPESVRDEPCWAELRLAVTTVPVELSLGDIASSAPRRLRVELVRGRGIVAGRTIELELHHETNLVHLPEAATAKPFLLREKVVRRRGTG